MPPKTKKENGAETKKPNENENEVKGQKGTKRKEPSSTSEQTSKEPSEKQAKTRTSSRNKQPTSPPSPGTSLHFILTSPQALEIAFPDDELSASQSNTKDDGVGSLITYSLTPPNTLSPWNHLLTASLLSKPLSHRLGYRSIRTLLNPPHSFTTASSVVEVGQEGVWKALDEARTQHKEKTASYIAGMAKPIVDEGGEGKWFDEILDKTDEKEELAKDIQGRVKGMGKIGAEVFLRRVQCLPKWEKKVFPFADGKALEAVRECGVEVEDAEGLWKIVESETSDEDVLGSMGLGEEPEGKDEGKKVKFHVDERKKLAFVIVLERCLGAVLEGKGEEMRETAQREA